MFVCPTYLLACEGVSGIIAERDVKKTHNVRYWQG